MNNTAQVAEPESFDDILPPEDFHKQYPHIPVSSIKWDAHERNRNGAAEAGAFARIGRKLCVVVPRYLSWKLANNG